MVTKIRDFRFVRKKKNRSGSISVVVVDKSNGVFKEIKCFGSSKSESEIVALCLKARLWIEEYGGQQLLDFTEPDLKMQEAIETERILSKVDSVLINGTQLLLNRIYDHIEFNRIEDDILRHLVIARISQPASKLATVAYLKSYYDEDLELNRIYRPNPETAVPAAGWRYPSRKQSRGGNHLKRMMTVRWNGGKKSCWKPVKKGKKRNGKPK